MRFERLHLKAFGAFTDRVIDFSGGKEGLHLVHGPNEAGKSTALRAITQLLYGIEARTADGFLHPLPNLRVGATLSNGADRLTFYRRKGNKHTLLDEHEKGALPEAALEPYLGGVDVSTFLNFFGLSHEQLVWGGQALVQGDGDVGQALFSAAAGTGDLRVLLTQLEDEAGELFNPQAKKPRINAALGQVSALRKAVKEAQLSTQEWQALDGELRQAEEDRTALDRALRAARVETSRLKRVQSALPHAAHRAALLAKLAPLEDAPRLPEDFSERRQQCQIQVVNAESSREAAAKALEGFERELRGLKVDEALLAQEDAIEEMNERRAQNQKALADRDRNLAPLLQRLERDAERTLHHLRPHWTLDQADDLRLAPGQARRIHELSNRGEKFQVEREHAEVLLRKRQRERALAAEAVESAGIPPDLAAVERALNQAAPLVEGEGALKEHRQQVSLLRSSAGATIARLGLESLSLAEAESLPVPSAASIERFRIDLDDARKRVAEQESSGAALLASLRELEALQAAEARAHDVPSLQLLEDARSQRQEGWRHARTAWEAGTVPSAIRDADARSWLAAVQKSHPGVDDVADAVAASIETADHLADRLRNEASRVAERAQREAQMEQAREALGRAETAWRAADSALTAAESAWGDLWAATGVAVRSPREMAEWRQDYVALVGQVGALREAEAAASALEERIALHRIKLSKALRNAAADLPFTTLEDGVIAAEAWLAEQRAARDVWIQFERQLSDLDASGIPEAEASVEAAEAALSAWQAEWAVLAEGLGAPATASSGEVLALADTINELLAQCDEITEKRNRIAEIDADDATFRQEARALAVAAGREPEREDGAAVIQALYAALKPQRAIRQDRDRLRQLRDAERTRRGEAEAALARVSAEWRQLCVEAGVASPEELPEAERRSMERRRLELALEEVEQRLAALSAGEGVDSLLEMVNTVEADTLASSVAELEAHIEHLDAERLQKQEAIGNLKSRLGQMNGSGAAAAKEEEVQELLAGIADDAEQYARLRVAAYVLRMAIERYREANQEPLLARAGEIFQSLTLGSFSGLRADVDDRDQHVLQGVRPGGGALVTVGGMSEGTADQLYLALRIACLERHLDRNEALPFILDDVLVNFDDGRAAAALDVLADVSKRTQVIYFTHHVHLAELARERVAGDRLFVQELGA